MRRSLLQRPLGVKWVRYVECMRDIDTICRIDPNLDRCVQGRLQPRGFADSLYAQRLHGTPALAAGNTLIAIRRQQTAESIAVTAVGIE
jgi:hypothetical protein